MPGRSPRHWRTRLLVLAIWAAAVVVLAWLQLPGVWVFVASVTGAVALYAWLTFVERESWPRNGYEMPAFATMRLLTGISIIGGASLFTLLCFYAFGVAQIGDLAQDQAIGDFSRADRCQLKDLFSVPSRNGYVAVVRDVNCPEPYAQGSSYFAVFVHRTHEQSTKQNLVFQYEPGFQGRAISGPPSVRWTGNAYLIAEPGVIELVVKMRKRIGGVSIAYSLGPIQSTVSGANSPE